MDYNKTWFLHQSARTHMRDFRCVAPRSHLGRETAAALDHLLFTRRGVFTKHLGRRRGSAITAEPTHVLLYNQGESFFTSHPGEGGDAGTVLGYSPGVLREIARELCLTGWDGAIVRFPVSHVLAAPRTLLRVFRLRDRLAKRLATPLEADEELLRTLAEVMSHASVTSSRAHPRTEQTRRKRRELVETVKQLLAASPPQPASLTTLAERLDTSPFHLTRLFRQETGVPLHQYHTRLRVTAALDRLAESSATLSAIGLDFGFSSHSHFTAAFRSVFGVPPSRVRATRRAHSG
jgi:AraC family transcriptional regulator